MKEEKIGPGITMLGFESAEEMAAYMAEQEADAVAGSLDEQWAITWGTYVLRIVDELWIFGYIYTPSEYSDLTPGAEMDEEIIAELVQLQQSHDLGYRYGRWFSEVVPDGEYGSSHVVNLWQISKADFDQARAAEWHPSPELAFRVGTEVAEAYKKKGKTDGS
jgi:hypothetical protein